MKNLVKLFAVFTIVTFMSIINLTSCCGYQKMNPPPDADKNPLPPLPTDNSCWFATAANMLAGAGYGNGSTVQQRTDDIYAEMIAHYTVINGGWPDAALQWWLNSSNNTWTNNPYTVVTYIGNKSMYPWNDQAGPRIIGNNLRKCNYVGICFSWPTNAVDQFGFPIIGQGGHATTAWGDNFCGGIQTINPTMIRITDSDRDIGGNIQEYDYDSFSNPNPGGPNEGSGWYFDFSSNHPYLRGFALLEPTDDPSDNRLTQIVRGSYKIHQNKLISATDLHYNVGTDVEILSYKTSIDWDKDAIPNIQENTPQRTNLTVDWDLKEKPVPYCNWITITTEFVLPGWNAMSYKNVHFTYPKTGLIFKLPEIKWEMKTPMIENSDKIPDVTGGYIIGSFDIISGEGINTDSLIVQYRFIHQYLYNQNPELHNFLLVGDKGYSVRNLKIGHSYGLLDSKELWAFKEWMTEINEIFKLNEQPIKVDINWTGKLPYPKGMDVRDILKYIRENPKDNTDPKPIPKTD